MIITYKYGRYFNGGKCVNRRTTLLYKYYKSIQKSFQMT